MNPVTLAEGAASTGMSDAVKTALTTAFSSIQTDVVDGITTALPYALGIGGLVIAITLVWHFFKRAAK